MLLHNRVARGTELSQCSPDCCTAGWLPLWIAVTLHEGSTLLVALNSLRLLSWPENAVRNNAPPPQMQQQQQQQQAAGELQPPQQQQQQKPQPEEGGGPQPWPQPAASAA